MTRRWMAISLMGLGLIAAPILSAQEQDSNAMPAVPGMVNYVEGAVYLDGQPLQRNEVGKAALNAGDELTTGAGKAEILLTPGVFLRVGSHSAVKMISPDLELTQVGLEQGRAGIEVDEIHDANNLQMIDAGITTRLQKTGYYEFNANHPEVMVFKGKAEVEVPDAGSKEVKGGHEFVLADAATGQPLAKEKAAKLEDDRATDNLFNWSKLRSEYLAESNNDIASEYANAYPGWYWDPFMWDYTYIGAGAFYSPFGWGFAPLGWGGWYGGGWGGRYYGHRSYGHWGGGAGAYRGGMGSGFHGGGGARR